MISIDRIEFGNLVINGKSYNQDLLLFWDGTIITKEKSHEVTESVMRRLLAKKPEIVILGIGFDGIVSISRAAKRLARDIELIIELTPGALKTFEKIQRAGKKVACLAHPTC
jgi:hypothetical protein